MQKKKLNTRKPSTKVVPIVIYESFSMKQVLDVNVLILFEGDESLQQRLRLNKSCL